MIAHLRRLRWLPFLLTLLSPAVGGELLPLLHPCPVELPWSADRPADAPETGADNAHAHHGGAAPAEEPGPPSHDHGDTGSCSCLGSCHTPVLLVAPRAAIVDVAIETSQPVTRSWHAIESQATARVAELLPPKTAPPIA